VPQDLRANDFASALASANASGLRTTNSLHIQPRAMVSGTSLAVKSPDSRASPDGNAVVVEEQMIKIAETRMDFETMVGLYQKSLGLLRLASRAPGR
jgi:flagellar basal-body rod protein FlgB